MSSWTRRAPLAISNASTGDDLAEVVRLALEIAAEEKKPGGLLAPGSKSSFHVGDLKRPMRLYLTYRRHRGGIIASAVAIPVVALGAAFLAGRASKG